MGYRQDDCQNDCWWDWRGYEMRKGDPDPTDPQFSMCMDACDTSFGEQYKNLVGVVDWKAVKRSLAEGTFTSFARFTVGDGDVEYGSERANTR